MPGQSRDLYKHPYPRVPCKRWVDENYPNWSSDVDLQVWGFKRYSNYLDTEPYYGDRFYQLWCSWDGFSGSAVWHEQYRLWVDGGRTWVRAYVYWGDQSRAACLAKRK